MTDIVRVTTNSNCGSGFISQTEYWNMKQNGSQYYGYWHNENVKKYFLKLEANGSVLVSSFCTCK